MKRQDLGLCGGLRSGTPLEYCCGGRVQFAPPAVGEALVGGIANQCVPETLPARAVGSDELAELGQVGLLIVEQLPEHVLLERDPEHRGTAEDAAHGRREPVQVDGDHALDRRGQLLEPRGRPRRQEELAQEQGVATAAGRERRDLVRPERAVFGCGDQKRLGIVVSQGLRPKRRYVWLVRSVAT